MPPKTPLADAAVQVWRGEGHAPIAELASLEQALADVCERGRTAWPTLELDNTDVARHLARHVSPNDDLATNLRATIAQDVWLALACVRADGEALKLFEHDIIPAVRTSLRRMKASDDAIEETLQIFRERLLVGDATRAPKLADYAGRGSLRSWGRAVATHIYLNQIRAQKPERLAGDDVLEQLASPDLSPELAHLKRLYHGEVKTAFVGAFDDLDDAERTTLRYFYIDGVNLDQLARLLGVSRATAHRRLQAARTSLATATTARLRAQLPGAEQELDSIRRLVQSQMSITDLSAALADRDAS